MAQAAPLLAAGQELLSQARAATAAAEAVLADATLKVRERVTIEGRTVARMLDREQRAAHGLSWLATYVESVRQLTSYAERMAAAGTLGETEELIVRIGIGEYLSQIAGGIPISQNEIVRPSDFGLSMMQVASRLGTPQVEALIASGNTAARRARLAVTVPYYEFREVLTVRSEDEHLEFKEATNNFHFEELVDYCVALANEGGGRMLLGILIEPGRVFRHHWGRTITESETTLFSTLTLHFNPHYYNAAYARAHGHPGIVANPLLVFTTVFGLTVEDLSEGGGPFLGVNELSYHQPVYPGDSLRAQSVVLDRRISESLKGFGIVTWHTTGFNQRDEAVIDFKRTNLVRQREAA